MESVSLIDLSVDLLDKARAAEQGRASAVVYDGKDRGLTQRLIALAAGAHVGEHDGEAEATLQVLSGQVRLHRVDRKVWVGRSADLVVIPAQRHDLSALEDAVVLVSSARETEGGT